MNCKYCKEALPSIRSYKLHHSIKHALSSFVCLHKSCGRTYPSWRAFFSHMELCSDNVSDSEPSDSIPNDDNLCTESDCSNNVDVHQEIQNNDFIQLMKRDTDVLVSKLYKKPKLPRQYVQDIVHDTSDFIKDGLLANLKKSVLASVNLDKDQLVAFEEVLSSYNNPFSHLSSEYLRFKYYESSNYYFPPVSVKVGEVDITIKTRNGPVLKAKDCFVQSIPVPQVLKKFLETPGALDNILSYMNSLDPNSKSKENFIQCELWKKKRAKFSQDAIVLPLHMYYDEVQVDNPLGSRTKKLGATYVSIPCLPPECQSCTDNIFLALLFESWMRDFSDEKVFAPFISQLKSLEKDGILIETPEGERRVFFVPGLLLGDNQGLNSIGGFVECFTANYFCRFCKTHKKDAATQSVEDSNSLRTEQSYEQDVLLNEPRLTGVKNECVFNQLESFHITSNYSVDVFHDLNEGVCHYVMLHLLKHCVPKFFTISELNDRIDMFQYGFCDSNKIPFISEDFLNRRKLKMSGSETLLFVKVFGVLVGDRVPHDDLYWRLYLKLCEILDVCMSRNPSATQDVSLKVLVSEFNTMYVQVTGDSLKAKMHNLVHDSTVYLQSGPFPGMSTKRYESKHRSITVPAHATESRVNISKTAAIQHQLNLCHRLISKESILPEIVFGPFVEVSLTDDFANDTFMSSLPDCFVASSSSLLSPNWINLKGTKYKPGMVLLVNVEENGGPVFGLLECILYLNNEIVFLYSHLNSLGLYEHVHGYEVEPSDLWSSVKPESLYDPLPLSLYHSVWGKRFVILRYIL